MKWIGKNIVDDVSLFRNDVHLDEKVVDSTGSAGTDGQQMYHPPLQRLFGLTEPSHTPKITLADTWVIRTA